MFRFYVTDHCVKNVRVWRFSGPYFPAFGLNTERISVKGFEKYTFPILGYLWSFFVYNKSKKKIKVQHLQWHTKLISGGGLV